MKFVKVMFLHVCACPQGVLSQHALQVVSQHALQVSRPTPRGEVEGNLAGGISRPTTKGEVEGDLVRGSPDPHSRGKLRGI